MRYNEFLLTGREKDQSRMARKQNDSGLAEYIRHELGNDTSLLRGEGPLAHRSRYSLTANRLVSRFADILRPRRVRAATSFRQGASAVGCQELTRDDKM